jgi:hypothetical protein
MVVEKSTDSDEGVRIRVPITARKAKTDKSKKVETSKIAGTKK